MLSLASSTLVGAADLFHPQILRRSHFFGFEDLPKATLETRYSGRSKRWVVFYQGKSQGVIGQVKSQRPIILQVL